MRCVGYTTRLKYGPARGATGMSYVFVAERVPLNLNEVILA